MKKRFVFGLIGIALILLASIIIVEGYRRSSSYYYGGDYYRPLQHSYSQPYYQYARPYNTLQSYSGPSYSRPSYTSPSYSYPSYATYTPYSSYPMYRYGYPSTYYRPVTQLPTIAYPTAVEPRGGEGNVCGIVYGGQYGCTYGLVCDYSQVPQAQVGVCRQQD